MGKRVAKKQTRKPAEQPKRERYGMTFWEKIKLTFHVLVTFLLLGVIGGVTYGTLRLKKASEKLPTLEKLANQVNYGVTEIYATNIDPATGYYVRLAKIQDRRQESVSYAAVPDLVKQCTVSIEDERFYNHAGIDAKGVLRALYANLRSGESAQGASTLTMQLARNVILEDFKKVADRKFKEMFLALQIERAYSKDQILERYLNEVCYGNNIYGIKAAARTYFAKDLGKLSLSEAALLAGIPQRPTSLEPFEHLDASIKRRNMVLDKMLELGYATPTQVAMAKKEKPKLNNKPDRLRTKEWKYPYFTEYVYKMLRRKLGEERVNRGGLKVFTTLNTNIQQVAERTIRNNVSELHGDGVRQGSIVAMDPHTGYVRAIAGGIDYNADQFNNAILNSYSVTVRKNGKAVRDAKGVVKKKLFLQGMQPGSSFKPIVYAAAFDLGLLDEDSTINDGYYGAKVFKNWKPKCYNGIPGHGPMSVREALAHSHNVAAVRAAGMVGIDRLVEYAHRLGIDSRRYPKGDFTHNYALSLGAGEVSPVELATVYSTFANDGHRADPIFIRCIYDGQGNVIERNEPQITRSVISHSAAVQISSCLRTVIESGTAARSGLASIPDAHGKTGTTSDNLDAWFAGYTNTLTAIVWISGERKEPRIDPKTKKPMLGPDKKPLMRTVKRQMPGVTGGQAVAPIWGQFIRDAMPIQSMAPGSAEYKTPDLAEAMRRSEEARELGGVPGGGGTPRAATTSSGDPADPAGDAPTALRPAQDRDFLRSGDPDTRVEVAICTETEKLATPFCPDVEKRRLRRRSIPKLCKLHSGQAAGNE
ncbi:MAG: transglycosylase domain-containing protein [Armatimonas sp.]